MKHHTTTTVLPLCAVALCFASAYAQDSAPKLSPLTERTAKPADLRPTEAAEPTPLFEQRARTPAGSPDGHIAPRLPLFAREFQGVAGTGRIEPASPLPIGAMTPSVPNADPPDRVEPLPTAPRRATGVDEPGPAFAPRLPTSPREATNVGDDDGGPTLAPRLPTSSKEPTAVGDDGPTLAPRLPTTPRDFANLGDGDSGPTLAPRLPTSPREATSWRPTDRPIDAGPLLPTSERTASSGPDATEAPRVPLFERNASPAPDPDGPSEITILPESSHDVGGIDGFAENYCDATVNSAGTVARIEHLGTLHLDDGTFGLRVTGLPGTPGFGMFTSGTTQTNVPFGNGFLCIAPGASGAKRMAIQPIEGTTLDRTMADHPEDFAKLTPGSTWNFQLWYRNPAAGGANFNLSDALSVHFAP